MNLKFDQNSVFSQLVEKIILKSPLQKKRILKHLSVQDDLFWKRAENFVRGYIDLQDGNNITIDQAAEYYLEVCRDMLVEQTRFARTGVYRYRSANEVDKAVYSNPDIMSYHMHGIAISQFLWPNHYKMYDFFCQEIKIGEDAVQNYLEIGAGHGLFLSRALHSFLNASFTVIDISEFSLNRAREAACHPSNSPRNIQFLHKDIMTFDSNLTFDFIAMGEVLEHVESPGLLLEKIYKLLRQVGRAYISTCCNCPAIDHIYLFRNVDEIHELFTKSGLNIHKEIVLPVETVSTKRGGVGHPEINYAAIVQRKE